jgi:hypothetical protein
MSSPQRSSAETSPQSASPTGTQGAACTTGGTFPQQDEPAKGRGMNDPLSYH